jgi:predicted class III extradiol MEMO1 family dioxygenase
MNYLNYNRKYFIKFNHLNLSLFISYFISCLHAFEREKNKLNMSFIAIAPKAGKYYLGRIIIRIYGKNNINFKRYIIIFPLIFTIY